MVLKQLTLIKPFVWLALVLISAVMLFAAETPVGAQSESDRWSDPVNLSQSGAASAPLLVVDSLGRAHALWSEDVINQFVYAREENGGWSRPFPVEFPFATNAYLDLEDPTERPVVRYTPTLIGDEGGRIHAFWLDEDAQLFYSQVSAEAFNNFGAWSQPQLLADSAVAVAATADSSGRVHVAYARTLDAPGAPAGIYHQRAFASGGNWTGPQNLYDSSYFRALTAETANLDIAITSNGVVWVGWDNPVLDQVLVAGSADGGLGWGEALVIDKRETGDASSGPTDLQLQAAGTDLHLFWQAGHEGKVCTTYQQTTRDNGASWQPRQPLPFVNGCQEGVQLLGTGNSERFFAATGVGRLLLSAWDGERWSAPQLQTGLSQTFVDPLTQRTVALGCRELALAGANRLLLAGCDQNGGGDVWSMQRSLEGVDGWFSDPSSWSAIVAVAEQVDAPLGVSAVADSAGRGHLFWQASNGAINYAQQVGNGWSTPVGLRTAAQQLLPTFGAAAGADGTLQLAWVDANSGNLLFSQVEASRANSPADWSDPVRLSQQSAGASTPAIVQQPNGAIGIAYALPLNEGRGIYLTQSRDGGRSWETPVLVFDAVDSNWAVVDSPRLAATGLNTLHLTWFVRNQPAPAAIGAILYARSDDQGQTWSAPDELRSGVEASGGQFVWSDLLGLGGQMVHRVWQRWENERLTVWHQVSLDNGISWSQASSVADGAAPPVGAADLAGSAEGHVALVYAAGGSVRQLSWTGSGWEADHPLLVDDSQQIVAISADIGNRQMQVAFVAGRGDGGRGLYAATNQLAAPAVAVDSLPMPTPTPQPTPTAAPTPDVQPTPMVVFPRERESSLLALPGLGGSVGLIFVGAIAALLIVLGGLLIGLRMVRGKR